MRTDKLDTGQVVVDGSGKKVLLIDIFEKQINATNGDIYTVSTIKILPLPDSGLSLSNGKTVQEYHLITKGVPLTPEEIDITFKK